MYFCVGFILLENLVSKLECPVVLDLKMGTRTYQDGDSEERKADKIGKANKSTTGSLGARIVGMQVSPLSPETLLQRNSGLRHDCIQMQNTF